MPRGDVAARIAEELERSIKRSGLPVPVGVSNRHFHITESDWRTLFGAQKAGELRAVKQPGQWAGSDTIDIEGPKGRIAKVRHLGPFRKKTQLEISMTDARKLGIAPPVRESGDLRGAATVRLAGPKGSVELKEGVIIAQRHIHFSPADAERFGVQDREMLRVRAGCGGPRELVFEAVLGRVSPSYSLEFHIDVDEANAAGLKSGDSVFVI